MHQTEHPSRTRSTRQHIVNSCATPPFSGRLARMHVAQLFGENLELYFRMTSLFRT